MRKVEALRNAPLIDPYVGQLFFTEELPLYFTNSWT